MTVVENDGGKTLYDASNGVRVSSRGVDWWTSGAPDRAFEVLGYIIDDRDTLPLTPKVIGSRSMAKEARRLGGDALILVRQDSHLIYLPRALSGGAAYGLNSKEVRLLKAYQAQREQVYEKRTAFAVVRYR